MDPNENAHEIQDSTPNANGPDGAAGEMGVSSERVGHAGPGQRSTDGVRDTALVDRDPDADTPAGHSSTDPRSD